MIDYESFVAFLGECVVLAISTIVIILLFGLKRDERLQLVSKLTMSVKRLMADEYDGIVCVDIH